MVVISCLARELCIAKCVFLMCPLTRVFCGWVGGGGGGGGGSGHLRRFRHRCREKIFRAPLGPSREFSIIHDP